MSDPRRRRLPSPHSLRGRLTAAFVLVTSLAVALVTVAGMVGSNAGLSRQQAEQRQAAAERAAAVAVRVAERDGLSPETADWAPLADVAEGAGARVVVRDTSATVVFSTTGGGGGGGGGGHGAGRGAGVAYLRGIVVDGRQVGTVTLLFPPQTSTGRPVAWRWIGAAALLALALATVAASLLSRSMTGPLIRVAATARAFAAGDRQARTHLVGRGELLDVATALDHLADQVETSEQARRRLTSDLAHEIRTPLAALQAGLEEVRDGLVPAVPARLARLHDQSLRLGRVVADLADLAAADAAAVTLRPAPHDLAAVVSAAVDAHLPQLRAAGLQVVRHIDAPVPAVVDAARIHQIVANLLSNCARHCRPGDTVTVTVDALAYGGEARGRARLVVADDGPGVAADVLPQVATRFVASGATGGSGLGLAIATALAEAHGGILAVTSTKGTGTTVTVTLPTAAVGKERSPG